jgi:CheY-like chemotaxis protein
VSGNGPARVLVVDDHPLNLMLLQRVLEIEGHDVVAVDSLRAARRAIAERLPELVVLDLQLPDGDGLDLARELRSNPRHRDCAILACTAGAMKSDEDRALAAGCDAYASKPIDTRGFARLTSSLLKARLPGPAARALFTG